MPSQERSTNLKALRNLDYLIRNKLESMFAEAFAPFQQLFLQLLPWLEGSNDGSHDLSHLQRVWHNARLIAAEESGDPRLLAAAVFLHDCVVVEKTSPLRAQASRLSAEKASEALKALGWEAQEIQVVADAVLSHSFSAGITPKTMEGKILQDADRLDAVGMVGIARCFYTAGRMGSKLYEPADPVGKERILDDSKYALDHFPKKLLKLSTGFQTHAGARMAQERHSRLQDFYERFITELEAGGPGLASETWD